MFAELVLKKTYSFVQWNLQTLLRFALLQCDNSVCVKGVSARIASLPIREPLFLGIYGAVNDRIYPLLGIIFESLLIIACFYMIILISCIWRVARASFVYFMILMLLLVSETFMLAFWAAVMRNFESLTALNIVYMLPSEHSSS